MNKEHVSIESMQAALKQLQTNAIPGLEIPETVRIEAGEYGIEITKDKSKAAEILEYLRMFSWGGPGIWYTEI